MIFASFVSDLFFLTSASLFSANFLLARIWCRGRRVEGALWSRYGETPKTDRRLRRLAHPIQFWRCFTIRTSAGPRQTSAEIKVKMKHAYIKIYPLAYPCRSEFVGISSLPHRTVTARERQRSPTVLRCWSLIFYGAGHELSTPQLLLLLLALFMAWWLAVTFAPGFRFL